MNKKIVQHMFTFIATALACAAVLVVLPNPDLPDPRNNGEQPGIVNTEDGEGEQPGVEPQDNRDPKDEKYG